MSNDTNFDLTFACPSREMLEHVIVYLARKKARWDAWQHRGKNSRDLIERTGAPHFGAVVAWGFGFGEIETGDDGEAMAPVTAWANENFWNSWISGDEGELADLLQKFPHLKITGTYDSEYGSGEMDGADRC